MNAIIRISDGIKYNDLNKCFRQIQEKALKHDL